MLGAIFDMDGLLIESEQLWQRTWYELAAEMGVTLGETFPQDVIGTGGARTREVIRRHYRVDDPEPIMRACTERVHKLEERGVPLKPGVRTILAGLRAEGYRIAVASSSPLDMIERCLRLDGVAEYFDVMLSALSVPHGKPAPDVFLTAAERLGVAPEACWVFEDSLSGVEAGWRSGARTIMIPDIIQPNERVKPMCWGIFRDLGAAWDEIAGSYGEA